jgi:hypothetical protein
MPRWPDMDESKRCIAMSKRTGRRCGLARIPGTTVCAKHGGAAPQVRAAAARRVAEQKVRAAAMKLEVDPQEVSTDPVTLLSGMIHSGAIMMERFSRLVDRCEDGQSLVYTARSGVRQIRPEFAALRAERESLGRHLELWLKVSMAQAQLNRDEAASQLTDRVATALGVAVTSVLLRHPELDALALHDEIKEEFCRAARVRTADHPEPERPRAIAG